MKQTEEPDFSKPFYLFKVTFNWKDGRGFVEGVVNDPVSKKEAIKMIIQNYGGKNNKHEARISYLKET